MKIRQVLVTSAQAFASELPRLAAIDPNFVLVFGAPSYFENSAVAQALADRLPGVPALGCSTAGEIAGTAVREQSCVVTAVRFNSIRVRMATTTFTEMLDSRAAGRRLGMELADAELRAVMVFGQGVRINGSALIEGLVDTLGPELPITGGLAGDYGAFSRTWTLSPKGVSDSEIVAVGFVGSTLKFGHGSFGGWETFGPARKVTRSEGNVLYELDGEPALAFYKRYLGDYAKDLPVSGLLFPFGMLGEDRGAKGLIRTILGIDENAGSLILAGDIDPEGYLKLMHASTDSLIDGAEAAALAARLPQEKGVADESLCVLVSCIGRRLVMGDLVDGEVEAVAAVVGDSAVLTGFYSNGEISPFTPGVHCKLHNQTMTITTIAED
ncbi:MAG: FIST C-terminal domain-containing protein [Candidatus Accumulibacter phosphatis]|uniref:FIST C-terminal domain-containing protein n=1 Tax=Candidatus Accumulibacter cognatus TaxID=2954383 RepID=A0A7D5NBX6_9PROT|nr:FIST N-terminal domain-containing protein [Accumulibacter sp.]MBN8520161.1 FIST C-terminal domain-containing protein [Accumulibacter sp.]MBO3709007.1 FIST C-terminal domain-containing protein [Accumulibacter sp.]MCQ1550338.1 FIST C-terminal domain-containing protein [Candidatus Accumulibacter phosphatis]QLH49991.1 MAG: FIST C-terminal domain-containing protein [Candidatus Accumulibacter cognatus]